MKLKIYIITLFKLSTNILVESIKSLSVARTIALSFLMAIFGGSIILYAVENLQKANSISYIDSLYMTASAFCVTGLATKAVSSFTLLGQLCLLIFIQFGGLGIVIVTVLAGMLLIKGISRNTKLNMFLSEVIDYSPDKHVSIKKSSPNFMRTVVAIFNISITIELLGAILLYIFLPENTKLTEMHVNKLYFCIFTSISAFNNAGLSITDDLVFLQKSIPILTIVASLIIIGGIGFPVIIFVEKIFLNIAHKVTSKMEAKFETTMMQRALMGQDPTWYQIAVIKLSIHFEEALKGYNQGLRGESNIVQTKLILLVSFWMNIIGGLLIFLFEYNNTTFKGLNWIDKLSNSIFTAVSSRTAGFNTFDLSLIQPATVVLIGMMMFIGGGPQGTAGGIKLTTFAILVQYLRNVLGSQLKVFLFGHVISKRSVAMSTRLYFLATTFLATAGLLFTSIHDSTKDGNAIRNIFFEMISAFGTVGFSLDFTTKINDLEKVFYCILMYIGRIGILTLMIAITGTEGTNQLGELDDDIRIQVG